MKEQEEMGRLIVEDRFIILMIFYGVLPNMHQQVVNNPKRICTGSEMLSVSQFNFKL